MSWKHLTYKRLRLHFSSVSSDPFPSQAGPHLFVGAPAQSGVGRKTLTVGQQGVLLSTLCGSMAVMAVTHRPYGRTE